MTVLEAAAAYQQAIREFDEIRKQGQEAQVKVDHLLRKYWDASKEVSRAADDLREAALVDREEPQRADRFLMATSGYDRFPDTPPAPQQAQ